MAVELQQAPTKRWTYEEYYRLDDDKRYEVIDGELIMAPAPDTFHQDWLSAISFQLRPFVKKNKLGRIYIAPVDVILDSHNTVQPDLVFIASNNTSIIKKRGIFGTPDVLIEILSPANLRRDRYTKKELYQRFGIKEYWIVDPANSAIEILVLRDGVYQLHASAEEKGSITSSVIKGFSLDLAELIADL